MSLSRSLILFCFLFSAVTNHAQNYLGVQNSNYAGVMATDLQPASFVDGRFKFDLNLFSTNFGMYQNLAFFDADKMRATQQSQLGDSYWWLKSFSDSTIRKAWTQPDSTFVDRYLIRRYDQNSERTLGMNMNFQFDIVNFMFHINPKIAVGFSAKVRSITNIDNLDPKLAYLAQEGLDYPDLWNIKLNEELLNINHLTWRELGFNYSQVILDEKKHFLKAGGRIKHLAGYTAAYMYTSNFSYNLFNQDTSQFLQGDFAYGYSQNFDNFFEGGVSGAINKLFRRPSSQFGIGLDLGAVYEWRPNWEKHTYEMDGKSGLSARNENKYKARVGFSILDLGGMRFQKGGLSRDFSVNVNSNFDLRQFDVATSFTNFDGIIDSLIQASTQNGVQDWVATQNTDQTFFMRTPSAFSIQADYHIWKWFYVNATGMFNIISSKRATHGKVANRLSITPSFDYAWFGLHLPFSVNEYSGFKSGIALRFGPLTAGVTDFRMLSAKGQVRGAEFFMGLRVPVLYNPPRDRDGDKVSDKLDECPVDAGAWALRGCPDRDGDGIRDKDDECADQPGPVELRGCPDKDGDGIADMYDDCPDVAGLRAFKGCPDTDGDGIIDGEDDCPEAAGSAEFKGCPDSDGDGIRDIDDACPQNAGPKENQGCPDTDGDGIFDFLDECPTIVGPKENRGCPWPDTDGDGILDKDDNCPTLKGPIENKGCPYTDTDKDGVLDKDDECPNTPGSVENKGCPVIEKEIIEVLQTAFDNLEFETGKDIIKEESKPSLDMLAEVLIKRPNWKLEIAGHTDNVGDDNANMVLSKKRAEAVRNHLVKDGVAAEKLTVFYFGETKPIADNNTPEGRKKNRRVEMKVVFD